MEAIKFNLSGAFAFFKKPDVNTYAYFTYSHIHKIALLGILGSILGLNGYNQQDKTNDDYPEFYEKLKSLKIGIVPQKPVFENKIQAFNNSVGYASAEEGGNLIVKEQWLQNPSWYVYILLHEEEIVLELKNRLLESRYQYIPYLGKNDHFAKIENVETINIEPASKINKIDSLLFKKLITDEIEEPFEERFFKYQENLPVLLDEKNNNYIFEKFIFTNGELDLKNYNDIYIANDKNIFCF